MDRYNCCENRISQIWKYLILLQILESINPCIIASLDLFCELPVKDHSGQQRHTSTDMVANTHLLCLTHTQWHLSVFPVCFKFPTVLAVHCGGHCLDLIGVPHLLPPEA